ncbi:MAG: CocE/NonD family hydrolase [Candidatus Heimdallarchaeota archaeon]|nr:CocE/NonD family hydrolase [Candidatus Heimdallarchaeota archaeon]
MKTKTIAIMISSAIVIASVCTVLIVFIPKQFPQPTGIDWQFPQNSTMYSDYIKVPYSVKMVDNVGLATDVYLPSNLDNALPVIFIRTPYAKDALTLMASYTQTGYAVVIQDFRGFYDSEGEKSLPFITEQVDGQISLIWITEQPWCNGKIGTWGPSALGIAQYLMAPKAPDSLKCQLPIVATPNVYNAGFRGGELRSELFIPWMEANQFPQESFDMLQENEKYNPIWDALNIEANYSDIHVASLHIGGWYDIFTQNTIDAYYGYQHSGGVGAQGNAKLIMGPWVHGGMFGAATGEFTFPNQDLSMMFKANDALFEKWLKNNSTLWDSFPNITYYLTSSLPYNPSQLGNNWYQAEEWPILSTPYDLYLQSNFSLLENPSLTVEDSLSYLYDPNNPVDTIGGGNLALPAGIYDQASLELRDDVLSFSTAILTEPLTIVGQMQATIYVSSNCTDTDFTVKITDVFPDNSSMIVTDTIVRARNRNSITNWEFLTPGEIYEISIPLDSTAYLFNEGHRFRVDISSSNYERFETNPNTGDALWSNTTTYTANNSIFLDATHMSRITLPIVNYLSLTPFDIEELTPSFIPKALNEEPMENTIFSGVWAPLVQVIRRR